MEAVDRINKNVKMGPMNGYYDKHPQTIIETCRILGAPLPDNAICGKPPSKYIKKGTFTGTLENVKTVLGKNMPDIDEDELKRKFRMFKRKFKSQAILKYKSIDFTVYFCDWLLFARDRGFTHNCYFDYELYNKEWDVRDTFLNEGYRIRVHNACSTKNYRHYLLNKAHFNKKFAKFIKRDWIDASSCTFEEFCSFLEKHEAFFAKPVKGTGGAGARIMKRSEGSFEELYDICRTEELILEEIIHQHPDLAEFNASTLNTVRITTLLCADNVPRILLTVARFGRAGKSVDNFHGGGVGAIVDIDSGKIITESINMAHERSSYHPDSKKEILGFQYPEWEKIKTAVCEAALLLPEMRNIGWDVAVTADGDVEFVEGNGRPNYDVLQSPDQVGRRSRYVPYLQEIEQMKGIEVKELPPLKMEYRIPLKYRFRAVMKNVKRKVRKMIKKR